MVHVTKKEVEAFLRSVADLPYEEQLKKQDEWIAQLKDRVREEAEAEPESDSSRRLRELREKVDELERLVKAEEARKDADD